MNNAVHASTGMTPFFVNGLRHPALPLSLMGGPGSGGGGARQLLASQLGSIPKATVRQSVDAFWSTRVNVLTRVRDAMAEAQDQQKEQADKHNRGNMSVFKIGDYVLLSTKNLSQDAVSTLGSSKLLPRYIGPFRVLKRRGTSYRLDLPSWLRTHPTFYVGRLKAYLQAGESESDSESANANASANDHATSDLETQNATGAPDAEPPGRSEGLLAPVGDPSPTQRPAGQSADSSDSTVRRSTRVKNRLASSCRSPSAPRPATSRNARESPRADRTGLETRPLAETVAPPSREPAAGDPQAGAPARRHGRPEAGAQTNASRTRRSRPTRGRLPVLDRSGEVHYHVEAIEGSRQRAGVHEALVKWLGYPRSQSTWRAWSALREDCLDLVLECERDHPSWFP
jgi:hypothetical protein